MKLTNSNKIDDLNYQVDTIDGKIQTLRKVNETKKKTILDTMNEDNLKQIWYKYYMDKIKRDGVPYELIEEGWGQWHIITIVDFNILEMDGKNINTYLTYNDDNIWSWSSGMSSSLGIVLGWLMCNTRPDWWRIW